LINENYINEERFAKAFTGMQFRMNKWGRLKIVHSLKQLNIPERLIHNSIEEIDEAEYRQVLTSLIMKKKSQIKSEEILTTQKKVATFAIGKGYEPELVWDVVKRMIQPYGNT
jgi:regulatory protein